MNARRFRAIGVIIVVLITATILLQGYYLYQDYRGNKGQFMAEVQQSLDNSVEEYYAELAKSDLLLFGGMRGFSRSDSSGVPFSGDTLLYSDSVRGRFIKVTDSSKATHDILRFPDSLKGVRAESNVFRRRNGETDSVSISYMTVIEDTLHTLDIHGDGNIDDVMRLHRQDMVKGLQNLTSKIVISITRDSIDFKQLNEYLRDELNRNQLDMAYALGYFEGDSLTGTFNKDEWEKLPLKTRARSIYLPGDEKLEIRYANASLIILRKGIWNILFSFFFLALTSGVLMYLYRTIRNQKELAEIKNDLISNITHEFKTPIATVSTAIEGIRNFNTQNDPEKTARYLQVSEEQLVKLNTMVEKLLETATLDSEKLLLHREPAELEGLLQQIVSKFQALTEEDRIRLTLPEEGRLPVVSLDHFHMENAISNLVDNALKYGGDRIEVKAWSEGRIVLIHVADNGKGIPKKEQQRIFEKFYRIPSGNVHDVKGFGIGLYYTRHVVQKHGGSIRLSTTPGKTEFTILLHD